MYQMGSGHVAKEKIIQGFRNLSANSALSDTIITVGTGQTKDFHVVAAILATQSEVFHRELFGYMSESVPPPHPSNSSTSSSSTVPPLSLGEPSPNSTQKKRVRVEEIDPEVFECILL